MHPMNFALLLTLAIVGCDPSGKVPTDPSSIQTAASTDTATVDSTQIAGMAMRHPVEWHLSNSDPAALIFDTGDTLPMHAKDLRLVSQVTSPLGKPWFIFSGIDSEDSDGLRALFVVSPGDSLTRGIQHSWHMPGRLVDSTSVATYYEASVFAGEVLRDTIGVVWYDRSLMPDGQWRLNTTLLQFGRTGPDTIILFGQSRKSATIALAVKGKCRPLTPIDQRTASH